jgi:hypothetical protein
MAGYAYSNQETEGIYPTQINMKFEVEHLSVDP